ncbi:D-alanyl-D-alanine carboxypeptidase family protein [Tropicimonas sp. IMCC34043]|uniref:D-alanyl-D-alanine carboxypeptidase family protein n=1 Tax=Tropicimonas sp. IMCC34043 TaxID=2248760 RepID=UPI000E26B552|nr:D-alanyl-D-alanine carboxypeptidase family protein [Tropicimonas sp. IMCC34043]
MTSNRGRTALVFSVLFLLAFVVLLGTSLRASAATSAAMVMDARTGKVYYSQNANTRVHPASLTKMMTLYITFEAIEHGEIGLDTMVTVSSNAANEVPSKLGLRAGQKIELRYLIRAAAVKSANDAATAIGEAIEGSEAAFARRMNRTAKALGMSRTTFKNANGLTEDGHMSTANDMSTLGRHLFYDYPQYYNLFSRRTTDAKIRMVQNTNRRFLDAYKGADGIKTGYTSAAGSNLVASAQRGDVRIITTVMGAPSSAARNARVAELMDLGFKKAPRKVRVAAPARPAYQGSGSRVLVADATSGAASTVATATLSVAQSIRPLGRPGQGTAAAVQVAAMKSGINAAVAAASTAAIAAVPPVQAAVAQAAAQPLVVASAVAPATVSPPPPAPGRSQPAPAIATAVALAQQPVAAPQAIASVEPVIEPQAKPAPQPAQVVLASASPVAPSKAPRAQPRRIDFTATVPAAIPASAKAEPVVVSRASTSGGRQWGINIGRYNSQSKAERVLLMTALQEMGTLDGALRKVQRGKTGFDANFVGLSAEQAVLACKRISAAGNDCSTFGPSGS